PRRARRAPPRARARAPGSRRSRSPSCLRASCSRPPRRELEARVAKDWTFVPIDCHMARGMERAATPVDTQVTTLEGGVAMSEELSGRLGENVRQLRQARGKTQQQMARLASLPRATWSNLESGHANPTLAVL